MALGRRVKGRWRVIVCALVVLVAAMSGIVWHRQTRLAPTPAPLSVSLSALVAVADPATVADVRYVHQISISPDQQWVGVSGSLASVIYAWTPAEPRPLLTPRWQLPGGVHGAIWDFSPDSTKVIIRTGDGSMQLINLADGTAHWTLRQRMSSQTAPRHFATSAAFSRDGTQLAIAYGDWIELRQVSDGHYLRAFGPIPSGVAQIAFTTDGARICAISAVTPTFDEPARETLDWSWLFYGLGTTRINPGELSTWRLSDGQLLQSIPGATPGATYMDASGRFFLSGSGSAAAAWAVFDLDTSEVLPLPVAVRVERGVAADRAFALSDWQADVWLWSEVDRRPHQLDVDVLRLAAVKDRSAIAISPDRHWLIVGTADGQVAILAIEETIQ